MGQYKHTHTSMDILCADNGGIEEDFWCAEALWADNDGGAVRERVVAVLGVAVKGLLLDAGRACDVAQLLLHGSHNL